MDLEGMAAVIRPRSGWEAIDLGFGMVRAWWRPVAAAWLATVTPAWLLLFLLLSARPGLALLVLWWLRPLFDRVSLFVLSRCLFGAPPRAGEVAAELPRLWGRDLLAGLTRQRLDTARSFHLPVGQLEGLRGGARQRRTALLSREGNVHGIWLTAGCSLLEIAFALALVQLVALLSPSPGTGINAVTAAAAEGSAPSWFWLTVGAFVFAAFTLVEPFYVAAGFSLYLTRRTRLEGWDVEIAFRRLAGRLTGSGAGRKTRGAAALMLVLVMMTALPARAAPAVDPARAAREILAGPDFRTTEKVTTWRRRRPAAEKPAAPETASRPSRLPSLPGLPLRFVRAFVLGLGTVLVAILVLLAIRGLGGRWWRRVPRGEDEKRALPDAVFGLDIRPESLPDDVPGAAWAAWERGEPAAALGLLYRGAIACLVHRDGLAVEASWTERDCVEAVRRRAPRETAGTFVRLTGAWQSTAYAHRPPDGDEMQSLCAAWGRTFRTAGREAAG